MCLRAGQVLLLGWLPGGLAHPAGPERAHDAHVRPDQCGLVDVRALEHWALATPVPGVLRLGCASRVRRLPCAGPGTGQHGVRVRRPRGGFRETGHVPFYGVPGEPVPVTGEGRQFVPPRLQLSGLNSYRGGSLECVAAFSLRALLCLGTKRGRAAARLIHDLPPRYSRVLLWGPNVKLFWYGGHLASGWILAGLLESLSSVSFLFAGGSGIFAARVRGNIEAALTCMIAPQPSMLLVSGQARCAALTCVMSRPRQARSRYVDRYGGSLRAGVACILHV
jgi:hypothetical protein